MTIVSKEKVRAAVERSLLLDPKTDLEAAVKAAAQALGLDTETVRGVVAEMEAS